MIIVLQIVGAIVVLGVLALGLRWVSNNVYIKKED